MPGFLSVLCELCVQTSRFFRQQRSIIRVYSRKQASGGSDEGTLFCVIGRVGNRDGDGVVGARVGRSPVSVCCAGQGGASQGGAGESLDAPTYARRPAGPAGLLDEPQFYAHGTTR